MDGYSKLDIVLTYAHALVPDIITVYDYEARGIPIGRVAEVNLRNNHAQYIFTWYVSSHT